MSGWGVSRMLPVRGLNVHVRSLESGDAGRGPLVLLHGFGGSADDWAGTAALLHAEGHTVHAIDLPGHGLTDAPAGAERYAPVELTRDLASTAEVLATGPVHWVGYSMGGRAALHMALAAPERVASLSLESASPGIADPEGRAARRQQDETLAAQIEERGVAWFAEHWESLPIFASQSNLPEETRDALRARRLRNHPAGLAGSLRGFGQGAQEKLEPLLHRVSCPVLLLTGALDPKYAALAERMTRSLPRAERVTIAAAGHNVHLEQPAAFARALLDHLDRIARTPGREAPLPA
jgi:2-succinyl-6-hydroxy-2,4-cyclohexadiene-1-carboxylate synthase